MTHLFFVTSVSEAKETIDRINRLRKTESVSIISNHPLANLCLADHHLAFQDSGDFFPVGKKLRSHQLKITDMAKHWAKSSGIDRLLKYRDYRLDDIVSFSLFIYLAEVEHSLLVAQNILKTIQPDVVHVSRRFTESPFRRYQTEELNLENLAVEGLSGLNGIKVIPISAKIFPSFPITSFAVDQLSKLANLRVRLLPPACQRLTPQALAGRSEATPTPTGKLTILANYYQLANLLPFLSKLKANNLEFTAIGKANTEQLELLNKSGIPFFPLGSTHSVSSTLIAIRYFYLWHRLKPKIAQVFNSYHSVYWNLTREKLKYLFTVEFSQVTAHLNQAQRIFSRQPKALLTMATNDTFSRCFAAAADRQGIKIIELQHGLVIFDEEAPFRQNHIHAVWGKPVLKIMNQGKRRPKSFAVTGFPYFDKYKHINTETQKCRNTEIPTILILATFPVAADRLIAKTSPYRFLEIILNAVKSQKKNWKIVFRPHPSYNAVWVKEIARYFSVDLSLDQREVPLDKAISSCDLIISNFTTAMVDAMFIGKPILLYSFADAESIKLARHPVITTGAVAGFSSSTELTTLLDKIDQRKFITNMLAGQKEFLKQYCSVDKKTSATKLSNLIKKMLK